jgi:hypothetical protein
VAIAGRIAVAVVCSWATVSAAQTPAPATVRAPAAASEALDRWIVTRYRGAGLMPDTSPSAPSLASTRTPPRIETVRLGETTDSLWSVHFSAHDQVPAFALNTTVRLAGPTGSVGPLAARIVARRLFRAPRRPNPLPSDSAGWREGWAYLAVLPHDPDRRTARYRGWLLLSAPRTARPARAGRASPAAHR